MGFRGWEKVGILLAIFSELSIVALRFDANFAILYMRHIVTQNLKLVNRIYKVVETLMFIWFVCYVMQVCNKN